MSYLPDSRTHLQRQKNQSNKKQQRFIHSKLNCTHLQNNITTFLCHSLRQRFQARFLKSFLTALKSSTASSVKWLWKCRMRWTKQLPIKTSAAFILQAKEKHFMQDRI